MSGDTTTIVLKPGTLLYETFQPHLREIRLELRMRKWVETGIPPWEQEDLNG